MTSIGGPGGVGPKGPLTGVSGGEAQPLQDSAAPSAAERSLRAEHAGHSAEAVAAQRAGLHSVDALAAEISAGRLSPKQAIDALVEAAGAQLEPADRLELREMLAELFANDPHLSGLVNRLG